MPDYFLAERHPTGLDQIFTVVWWEQRGAGLSYRPDIPRHTMTMEQFITDTLTVTDHLRNRFGTQKIYLLGHSWGSFIGIQAAARTPERYHAYIGMAQLVHQLESERRAYEYMLDRYRRNGDRRMVQALEAAPVTMVDGTPNGYLKVRDPAMHRLGIGTTHAMRSVITGIFLRSLLSGSYTLREKVNIWRGRAFSRSFGIWDKLIRTDLAELVPELALPVYFFHGIFDYTANHALAHDYLEQLKAPVKGFYTFGRSAHSPVLEEPEKARTILRQDVLVGANRLADA
jgi:pimeloyl-ACP methyl ester carboxylesterase